MPLLFDGFDDHGWNRVSHRLTHSDRTESTSMSNLEFTHYNSETSQSVGMSIKRVFFSKGGSNCPYNIWGGSDNANVCQL